MNPEDFWASRPVLTHIHTLARARRAGPWATLGVAMARAVITVPASVALPGTVGGRQSLNLFVAPVGPSGGGKGAAEAAAAEGIRFTSGCIDPVPVGSGEGVARTFRPAGTKPDEPNAVSAALFSAPEVDSLAALAARTGSTLSAELRKLYSGETIGFANAGKDTRNIVAAHTYRAAFIVGVQPLRSDALLGGADGGLPQRFLWLPVSDPDAPETAPDDPGVWTVKVPAWVRSGARHLTVIDDAQRDLIIPDEAITEIRSHRLAVLREDPDVDALDGHRLLTQLKAAAALMALDGRTIVSAEDWLLAATVMDVSASTRDMCQSAIRNHARTVNTARALASADRDEIVSDRKLQRAKQAVLRWLGKNGELPSADLRRRLKADLRDYFGAAVAELAAEGAILECQIKNGTSYRIPAESTRVPEVHPPLAQFSAGVPVSTRVPAGNVTELDSHRSQDSTRPRLSCQKWLNQHVQELLDAGHTTAESFAVIEAGQAQGYTKGSIHQAVSAHPDMRTVSRKRGRAVWSITPDYRPPQYESAAAWLDKWLDQQDNNTVSPDEAKTAGIAAGHPWHSVRRAAGHSTRIVSIPAHGDAKNDRLWTIVSEGEAEEAGA